MKYIFGFLIILFIVLLQASLLPLLAVNGVWPNLILVYLLSLKFTRKVRSTLFLAIVGGVLLDLTQNLLFGLSSLVLVILLSISSFFFQRLRFKYLQIGIFTMLASLIMRAVSGLPNINLTADFIGAILDLLLIIVAFPLTDWAVDNLLPKEDLHLNFRDKL